MVDVVVKDDGKDTPEVEISNGVGDGTKGESNDDATTTTSSSDDSKNQSASIGEVFSFARARRTRLMIAGAFACAIVSGATLPGKKDRPHRHACDAGYVSIVNVRYSLMLALVIFSYGLLLREGL